MLISYPALRGLMASVTGAKLEIKPQDPQPRIAARIPPKSERIETQFSRTTIAWFHASVGFIASLTCIILIIVMKAMNQYTKDIWWPGISDTGRRGPGYWIMIFGFGYSSFICYFMKRYFHFEYHLPLVAKYAPGDRKAILMIEWLYSLGQWIPFSLFGIALFDVGRWPWIHYGMAGIWFIWSMAIEFLQAKFYFYLLKEKKIPEKHAKVMRNGSYMRMAVFWVSLPFILMNLYPANFRLMSYAEAKIRLEPTNPGLADQCKLWKSSEPYNWRRTDGKGLWDDYDDYHLGTFERIPYDELIDDGSRYYHTSIISFDHCVVEGWLWSVAEIIAIIALAFGSAIMAYDLVVIGPDLRAKKED